MNIKNVVLLHGALGCEQQLMPLKSALTASGFKVRTLNFSGHGGTESAALSIQLFADELEEIMLDLDPANTAVFGFSMGGYVALFLAAAGKLNAAGIITLGTKFDWSPESAAKEVRHLDPVKIQEKVPAFAAYLESLHGKNWDVLLRKTADMMLEMGSNPPLTTKNLPLVHQIVRVMRGENDAMVTEEETRWAVNLLPKAQYISIPGWQHPIDRIPLEVLVEVVKEELSCM